MIMIVMELGLASKIVIVMDLRVQLKMQVIDLIKEKLKDDVILRIFTVNTHVMVKEHAQTMESVQE